MGTAGALNAGGVPAMDRHHIQVPGVGGELGEVGGGLNKTPSHLMLRKSSGVSSGLLHRLYCSERKDEI